MMDWLESVLAWIDSCFCLVYLEYLLILLAILSTSVLLAIACKVDVFHVHFRFVSHFCDCFIGASVSRILLYLLITAFYLLNISHFVLVTTLKAIPMTDLPSYANITVDVQGLGVSLVYRLQLSTWQLNLCTNLLQLSPKLCR